MAKKQSSTPAKTTPTENPVFAYIIAEANAYRTQGVPLTDNWDWSMYEHIKRSFSYKNSKFVEGENDGNRPFKNIVLPILNVAYRAENIDVKNIVPFVDDDENFDKSFFVKKFAHKWGIDNGLDDWLDDLVESFCDYGLALKKSVKGNCPEIVPLQRLAFCDQTDIMTGPKCEMHSMTIDDLEAMRGKWNDMAIDVAIDKARNGKMVIGANKQDAKTPGKYAEVYELHGTFPSSWLSTYPTDIDYDPHVSGAYDDESTENLKQVQICSYYYDDDNNKIGITFFKGPEKKEIYDAIKRDKIFGRACGRGGVEELFDPQQWTNYSEIQLKEMLDVASMIIIQTASDTAKTKNNLTELEKGEILEHEDNKPYTQVAITPQNKALFDQNVDRWNQNAQNIGSANEALLGQAPAAGTPFSLQALIVQQGFGLHDWRKGKLATFVGKVYKEDILPALVADMKKGNKWLAKLDLDEMQGLVDNIVNIMTADMLKKFLLKGMLPTQVQAEEFKQTVRDGFMKDSKKFLEIIDGELKDIPVDVEVDVAGKQYDLQDRADKLTNIFRQVIANPQILQMPGMAKLFNEIIESSGFSPVDFSGLTNVLQPTATAAPASNAAPATVQPSPVPTNQPVSA